MTGIVAEYNPLHNGHAWHLGETKRLSGGEPVVVVMSGNAVQRGEFALLDKRVRAEAALRCGADLVLELPVPWALSSAEGFARGAVALLGAAGCDSISFGSESGNSAALLRCADALSNPRAQFRIRELTGEGVNYGAARQQAAEELAGADAERLWDPNDLLGAEYLAAAKELGFELAPLASKRRGADHDGTESGETGFASASELRRRFLNGEDVGDGEPREVRDLLSVSDRQGLSRRRDDFSDPQRAEIVLLSALRTLPAERFERLPGAGEGFGRRLFRAAKEAGTLEELYQMAKTRRYALSRIRRMVLWAALGLEDGDADGTPPYLRVLGLGGRGQALLRELKTDLPVITKPASVRKLGGRAERIFEKEALLTDLFRLSQREAPSRKGGSEWQSGPCLNPSAVRSEFKVDFGLDPDRA